jgi:flagellar protein FlaG
MVNEISRLGGTPPSAGAVADARPKPAAVGVTVQSDLPDPVLKAEKAKASKPKEPLVQFDPEKMMAQLNAAVERLNQMAQDSKRAVSFQADKALGYHVIKVTNVNTGELVRTIPTDVAIRVAHNIEAFKGLLHDASV